MAHNSELDYERVAAFRGALQSICKQYGFRIEKIDVEEPRVSSGSGESPVLTIEIWQGPRPRDEKQV